MEAEIKNRIEQIRQGKVPAEYQKTPAGILPKSWKVTSLCNVLKKKNDKNKDRKYDRILTNSATKGIVPQTDYFDKQIANDENTEGYYVVEKGDFVYNPRISVSAPCGPFNKYYENETGIMSPLYSVYQFVDENVHYSEFLAQYFLSAYWYRYMNGIANYGARSDRMNVTQDMMDLMPLPYPPESEYKKIVRILLNQDRVIALREKLLAEKLRQKQYLMQVLLTGKKRLSGFNGKWKVCRLDEVLCERKEKAGERDLRICSVAVHEGVVDQLEHLGRRYAAQDTSNYAVVHYGDIVYTKSPTGDFPFGIIKQSFLQELVAVSPLYGVFIPANFWLGQLLHMYFQSAINTKNYLLPIVQKGAKNTINISNQTFLSNKLYLPMEAEEQEAIAKIFLTIEREIALLEQVLIQERRKKKALMQLLLSGIVRVR